MSDPKHTLSDERVAYLDGLVRRAQVAAAVFTQYTQEDVDRIVKPMVLAGMEQAQYLARLAVEEGRLGLLEDKAIKNMVATEFVYNYVRDKRTVGVISEHPETGVSEVAEPIGVILSLLPVTNPTSTALFKCIMAVKTRNCMIFSAHPRTQKCSNEAARIMAETAVRHGAPEGFISWVENGTLADTHYLMGRPEVRLIDATGGPGVVKAAYSSGKPALGVGAGNTPVYLEKTADLDMAVVDIITSKTFDNGTICASEQTVVIDDEHLRPGSDQVLGARRPRLQPGGGGAPEPDRDRPGHRVHAARSGRAAGNGHRPLHRDGGPAGHQADAGPDRRRRPRPPAVGGEAVSGAGRDPGEDRRRGHQAVPGREPQRRPRPHRGDLLANDEAVIAKFGEVINAGRLIVNSPGSIGALGGVYNDMVPTFSFGCGTGGGNSTIDNVNIYHYLNVKRMARRTQAHMWFRVPNQIFFNKNAVENLHEFPSQNTVIVSNPVLEQLGYVDVVRRHLRREDARSRAHHPGPGAGPADGARGGEGRSRPSRPTRSSPSAAAR